MKFNLLSDNKRNVLIAIFVGLSLINVDILIQYLNIGSGHFLWTSILGGIVIIWSIFSYYFIFAGEKITLNPSRMVGNISFLILSVSWVILWSWIYLS